jgi:hypothetical protein
MRRVRWRRREAGEQQTGRGHKGGISIGENTNLMQDSHCIENVCEVGAAIAVGGSHITKPLRTHLSVDYLQYCWCKLTGFNHDITGLAILG